MKILYFMVLLYLVRRIVRKPISVDCDILIAPGGFKGLYMIGICHYLKNHFPTASKSMVGFSCGSFIALFMRLNPALDYRCLKSLFQINQSRLSMTQLLNAVMASLEDQFVYEDFDLRQTRIGVTTTRGLELYDQFTSMHDAIQCCRSSSFIPFITHPDVFLFYRNRLTLDGGFHYKKVKKNKKKETLLITSSMFGRYRDNLYSGYKKPKCSYYQLYLYGYQDAKKNHAFFEDYFKRSGS
jgi:hypothetical protein